MVGLHTFDTLFKMLVLNNQKELALPTTRVHSLHVNAPYKQAKTIRTKMRARDGDVSEDHGDGDLAEGVQDAGSGGGPDTTATRAVPPTQWPTSVVVVPSGCPVRCLRGDMGTALVFGV